MEDTIIIGKVFSVHGIRGELKVYPLTDDPSRFHDLSYCLLKGKEYSVQGARLHKGAVLLKLKGIEDRTAAETCKNQHISVYRKDSVPLEEGEYFIEDLKGLTVRDKDGAEAGTMTDVLTSAPVDIYVFTVKGKELLLPALKENILSVDLKQGFIQADLSKGVS